MQEISVKEDYILETHKLVKEYKGKLALAGVSMHVNRGDIYGFVGENGSGKTTVIRTVTGMIFCEAGTFSINGIDSRDKEFYKELAKIGAIVETPAFFGNMTALDNLIYIQKLMGNVNLEVCNDILALVDLNKEDVKTKMVGDFSLGMKQRLAIGMCLIKNPEFMILDEPMNGLDPQGIVELRNVILNVNKYKNVTFLISSHILNELSLVATKFGIISRGKIVMEITKEDVKKKFKNSIVIKTNDNELAFELLKNKLVDVEIELKDNIYVYDLEKYNETLSVLLENNLQITSIEKKEGAFEEYYMRVMEAIK